MLVFLVSGLWHGASLTFVVWGLLHGLLLVIQTLIPAKREPTGALKILTTALTFAAVCFIWIFFRSATLAEASEVIRSVFADWKTSQTLSTLGMTVADVLPCCLAILILPAVKRLPAFADGLPLSRTFCDETHRALLYGLIILTIVICRCFVIDVSGVGSFIYFSF